MNPYFFAGQIIGAALFSLLMTLFLNWALMKRVMDGNDMDSYMASLGLAAVLLFLSLWSNAMVNGLGLLSAGVGFLIVVPAIRFLGRKADRSRWEHEAED